MSKNKANQKNGLIKRLTNLKSEEEVVNPVSPEATTEQQSSPEINEKVTQAEVQTPTALLYRGSLLPVNQSILDLAIKSPIIHNKIDVPGLGNAFVLATAHYGEILILENDIEAAAAELATDKNTLSLASELYHLTHSKYRIGKPAWLIAFETSL